MSKIIGDDVLRILFDSAFETDLRNHGLLKGKGHKNWEKFYASLPSVNTTLPQIDAVLSPMLDLLKLMVNLSAQITKIEKDLALISHNVQVNLKPDVEVVVSLNEEEQEGFEIMEFAEPDEESRNEGMSDEDDPLRVPSKADFKRAGLSESDYDKAVRKEKKSRPRCFEEECRCNEEGKYCESRMMAQDCNARIRKKEDKK